MIILPDKNIPRTKILRPVRKRDWYSPEQGTFIYYTLTARTHDGVVVWRGRFDDRDDLDAFLFVIASGSLQYERELWWLPTPWWPDLPEGLIYQATTYNVITSTGSGTYTVPTDYTVPDSVVHCIGAGASGSLLRSSTGAPRSVTGGGGGAYASKSDVSLTPGGSVSRTVGAGGAALGPTGTTQATVGNAGGDTDFNSSTVLAKGGQPGGVNSSSGTSTGGVGGSAASCVGDVKYSGGNGGSTSGGANGYRVTSGGGAAGPNGAGVSAADNSTSNSVPPAGGDGGAGSGGVGGAGASSANGTNGGDGTDITGSAVGSGGGGGGAISGGGSATYIAGNGGLYGAGGGAAGGATGTIGSGSGANGVIVVEYTPASNFSCPPLFPFVM